MNMLDTPPTQEDTMAKAGVAPSALEQVQKLQQQMKELSDQAREEALAQAEEAVTTLNALWFHYRLVNGGVFFIAYPQVQKQHRNSVV